MPGQGQHVVVAATYLSSSRPLLRSAAMATAPISCFCYLRLQRCLPSRQLSNVICTAHLSHTVRLWVPFEDRRIILRHAVSRVACGPVANESRVQLRVVVHAAANFASAAVLPACSGRCRKEVTCAVARNCQFAACCTSIVPKSESVGMSVRLILQTPGSCTHVKRSRHAC